MLHHGSACPPDAPSDQGSSLIGISNRIQAAVFGSVAREVMLDDPRLTMPTLMRVEFSRGLRPNSPRFVLVVEISDSAMAELNAGKISLEKRAYEIASEIRNTDRLNKPESQMGLVSCTKAKVKNLEALGEPSLLTHDACRAWVIKRPSPTEEALDKGWQSRSKNPSSNG
jgi:hypothetical protein